MLGVNFGNRVQRVARCIRVAALGQGAALEGHALFKFGMKQGPWLQKQKLILKVAKGILGFEMQRQGGAHPVALQCFLDAGQQVIASHQKFDGFVKHIKLFAQDSGRDRCLPMPPSILKTPLCPCPMAVSVVVKPFNNWFAMLWRRRPATAGGKSSSAMPIFTTGRWAKRPWWSLCRPGRGAGDASPCWHAPTTKSCGAMPGWCAGAAPGITS